MFFFPFSTLHELNLDWILAKMKYLLGTTEENNRKADYAVETADEAKTIAEQAAQAQIADGAVTTIKLADNAVTTPKIANNNVTFAKLENDIQDNIGAVILPTGDNTDRKAEIESKLTQYGYCEFRTGEYYISEPIRLYDTQSIKGVGKSSVIKKLGGASTPGMFYATGTSHSISIKNLRFQGSGTTKPGSPPVAGEYALSFDNHAGEVTIENCEFYGLQEFGLKRTSGYNVSDDLSLNVSNCLFRYCGEGINLAEYGEFCMVDNCAFIDNYYGVIVQGGNNKFSNCGFDDNAIGFYLYDTGVGTNDGHGSAASCSFNHNTVNAIKAENINFGYIFSACNIFDGDILLDNSSGILFDSCIIQGHKDAGVHSDITVTNCSGSISVNNTNFLYTPTETITNSPNYSRSNCKYVSGLPLPTYFRRLTTTYTSQSYVTEEDFNRIVFYELEGVIYVKCNLRITNNPGENFIQIGTVNLPFTLRDANQVILSSQSNYGNLMLVIYASGEVDIYASATNGGSASGWYRGQFVLM